MGSSPQSATEIRASLIGAITSTGPVQLKGGFREENRIVADGPV